jgi:hypothetical protein
MWGKIEYNKHNEPYFKVVHPDLELEKKNVSEDEEVMNYKSYVEWKFKFKTAEEVSDEEERKKINEELK